MRGVNPGLGMRLQGGGGAGLGVGLRGCEPKSGNETVCEDVSLSLGMRLSARV